MLGYSAALFLIGAILLFLIVDYMRLRRPEEIKQRPTFAERARQNPQLFQYALGILSKLKVTDAETLESYINVNDVPPRTDIELLDLIYQHIIWQGIADGRAGTVGNPHANEVIRLEELYVAIQQLVGPVPSARREMLHATFTDLSPNTSTEKNEL